MRLSPGDSTQPGDHDDIVQFGRAQRRRRWLGPMLLACLVAVAVFTAVHHSGQQRASVPPAPPPVSVTNIGHPILGVRAGWELFGLDRAGLVAVQFARGRIVRTAVPPILSGGPVFFVAAHDEAIVRPLDNVPGYVVPDGKPARQLTGTLAHGGILLPGPTLSELWFGSTALDLLGLDGKSVNTNLPAVARAWSPFWVIDDGAGGVLLINRTSQVEEYDAGPGMLRPVGAQLVAVGPTAWLGMRCDTGPCQDVVISTASGASHPLPGPPVSLTGWSSTIGAVAPDGSTAAVIVPNGDTASTLELISLVTGVQNGVPVAVTGASSAQLAWSPDSRWLFVVTAHGGLDVVDPRTGRPQALGMDLTGLSQIAIRPEG